MIESCICQVVTSEIPEVLLLLPAGQKRTCSFEFSSESKYENLIYVLRCHGNYLPSLQQEGSNLIDLTWPVLGEDPAARSHRVDQFTAL